MLWYNVATVAFQKKRNSCKYILYGKEVINLLKKIKYIVLLLETILCIHCDLVVDNGNLGEDVLAGAIEGTTTILISERLLTFMSNGRTLEFLLILSHEMRHVYQFEHKMFRQEFDRYIHDGGVSYASQSCEVDANAFAYLTCFYLTGKTPSKRSWQTEAYSKITKRANILSRGFSLKFNSKEAQRYYRRARQELGLFI